MLNQQPSLDRVFHALADPTRRAIVERLTLGEAPVGELAKPRRMTLAAVVQHIQILEQSGLVVTHKAGRVHTCRVEPRTLQLVETWVAQRRALWERRLDGLGEILAEPGPITDAGKDTA